MSRYVVHCISHFFNRLENSILQFFGKRYPPEAFALVVNPSFNEKLTPAAPKYNLKDLIGDGILWAVPKHRRSVEKRLNRKFGHPEYVWKLLKVKKNLLICQQCGSDHEAGILCPTCYNKVRTETQLMQEKIQEKLGLQPVDKEVIVLYEGEKGNAPLENLKNKQIVEIPKPRPMWFSKNLLQKSTQPQETTKEVKPSDLG